jgi:hypothetical protein
MLPVATWVSITSPSFVNGVSESGLNGESVIDGKVRIIFSRRCANPD